MVQMLEPQPGESIYDPTCGTGGMLISALDEVKRSGGEHRTLRLYGQERNHMTAVDRAHEPGAARRGGLRHRPRRHAGAARLHRARPAAHLRRRAGQSALFDQAVEPRGVAERSLGPQLPRHAAAGPGRLRLLPAHPDEHGPADAGAAPSSSRTACSSATKRPRCGASWSRPTWSSACWGWGRTSSTTRRWRRAWSICRSRKPPERQGRILFIDAVNEVTRERAQSFLQPGAPAAHPERVPAPLPTNPALRSVATLDEIAGQGYSLSIPLYVKRAQNGAQHSRT